MNNRPNIITGVLLISIGLLFLGKQFGLFSIDWHIIFKMWPLILIFWGIEKLIGVRTRGAWILGILLLFGVIGTLFMTTKSHVLDFKDGFFEGLTDSDSKSVSQEITEELDKNTQTATLDLGGDDNFLIDENIKLKGGMVIKFLPDKTEKLLEIKMNSPSVFYSLKNEIEKEHANITLTGKKREKSEEGEESDKSHLSVKLNSNLTWNLRLAMSASKGNYDFQNHKIQKLDIRSGASDMRITLGDKQDLCEVSLKSAASKVKFNIPKNSGCRVKINSPLTQKKLKGFIANEEYLETENYKSANKKIEINYESAAGMIEVERD